MGFFDKLKNAIGGITDETVREVSDNEELKRLKLEKKAKERKQREDSQREARERREKEQKESSKKRKESDEQIDSSYEEIDITNDDDFISLRGEITQTPKDILKNEGIPATYEIGKDIILPEEMDKVKFSEQIPSGYDMGEVRVFMRMVKATLEFYKNVIDERQEHVARLASIIDKLIVDNNNLKFKNEAAEGINIMTSDGTEDLENEVNSLRIKNQKLQDENEKLSKRTNKGLSSNERDKLVSKNKDFSNTISLLERKIEDLEEELRDKNLHIAGLEEDASFDQRDYEEDDSDFELPDDDGETFGLDQGEEDEEESEIDLLPDDEDLDEIPEDVESYSAQNSYKYKRDSEFNDDVDETLDDFIETHREDFASQSEFEGDEEFPDLRNEDSYDFLDEAVRRR